MKITVDIPDEERCNKCPFHRVVEVIEVGMSPDEHWCGIFHQELGGWGDNLKPCSSCMKARREG